ncbi:hypothetical protein MRX96_019219 [Rhipicephalus microplus]
MRLSTSLATCKSRDGTPLAVSSIPIPLDVAAKLARRTRGAGFYCRDTTHRRVEARGVRTVDLPARLPARPLRAKCAFSARRRVNITPQSIPKPPVCVSRREATECGRD